MQKVKTLIFLSFFLLTIFCQSPPSAQSAKSQIENVIHLYSQAFDQKDFKKFASFCSDEFKFYTLDGQIFDKKQAPDFLEKILKDWDSLQTEIQQLEIKVDEKLALARYTVVYHHVVDGIPGTMTARITAVFLKKKDTWQLYHLHMSRRYV